MSPAPAIVLFAGALLVTLGASEALVRALDRLGACMRLSEGLLGLLTALGADAPEISSAAVAMHAGAHDVGIGVVLGSNLFNLAALLGLGAVLSRRVHVHREGLILDGGVTLVVTGLAALLLFGLLSPLLTVALLALVIVPYAAALGCSPRHLRRLPLGRLAHGLAIAVSEVDHEAAEDPRVGDATASWRAGLLALPALALIIAGSFGMVTAALSLATAWRLPDRIVGAVVLAGLTSLPNAYAAARLARQQRGAALVSETFNSNTINLLAGVAVPALLSTSSHLAGDGSLEIVWLSGLTVLSLALLARPGGLRRRGGAVVIALYVLYVFVRVAH